MQRGDLIVKKHKRILFYWQQLELFKIDSQTSIKFMSEIFNLTEDYMYNKIIQKYNIDDFAQVRLDHLDLDQKMIENFVEKKNRKGRKASKKQLSMFL